MTPRRLCRRTTAFLAVSSSPESAQSDISESVQPAFPDGRADFKRCPAGTEHASWPTVTFLCLGSSCLLPRGPFFRAGVWVASGGASRCCGWVYGAGRSSRVGSPAGARRRPSRPASRRCGSAGGDSRTAGSRWSGRWGHRRPSEVGRGRGVPIARGPFPPAACPNRTCGFHRIRLSTSPVRALVVVRVVGSRAWVSRHLGTDDEQSSSWRVATGSRRRRWATIGWW